MSSLRNVSLTFDYELYFRESGTIERCMLEPTEAINALMIKWKMRGTFFIDTLCLEQFERHACWREKTHRVKAQLETLVRAGHELGLHLHPHWIDAVPEGDRWVFPTYRHYRLQSLPEPEVTEMFRRGVELLNEIYESAGDTRKVVSFRAGGLCISPFQKLREGFRSGGIRIDSSVAPGIFNSSETHSADFRFAPTGCLYRFSDDPLHSIENGEFLEAPITTFVKPFYSRLFNQAAVRLQAQRHRRFGDGTGLVARTERLHRSVVRRLAAEPGFLSLEGYAPRVLKSRLCRSSRDPFVVLSHPKAMSRASLDSMDLIGRESGLRFVTLREAAGV